MSVSFVFNFIVSVLASAVSVSLQVTYSYVIMFSKRLSVSARVGRQQKSPVTHVTETRDTPAAADAPVSHYNDWPNAVGFDAVYEEHEPVELTVRGHIPAYTAGTLFRTGIGPRNVKDSGGKVVFKTNHWFDAFSQVHRFQLHTPPSQPNATSEANIEKVTYNSRLTSDRLIERARRTGKISDITFGAKYEPCKTFFHKLQSAFERTPDFAPNEVNNAVTMSINFPGLSSTGSSQRTPHDDNQTTTLCNKTDATRLQFLDPVTLEPTGLATQANLHPSLKGPMSAAHPEVDPVTGDLYNFNMNFTGPMALYHVYRTSVSTGTTTILATIRHAPAYLHSLFLTEHFIILCIWNSHITKAGVSVLWNKNILDAMYFNTDPAVWYVIDRKCPETEGGAGLVAKFESDPFFAFHSVNSYEVPSTTDEKKIDLICDVSAYEDSSVLHHFYMDNLQSDHPQSHEQIRRIQAGDYAKSSVQLRRYRLPSVPLAVAGPQSKSQVSTSKAELSLAASKTDSMELPTFNPDYTTKPYRYVYGIVGPRGEKSSFVDALIKYDFDTRQAIRWEVHGHTPGEAVFIPRPSSNGVQNAEDDGVLLTVVLDGYTGKSYLLCLDARDMTEMGRADVNGPVGFGFHGAYTSRL